jgi:hypothetical protein
MYVENPDGPITTIVAPGRCFSRNGEVSYSIETSESFKLTLGVICLITAAPGMFSILEAEINAVSLIIRPNVFAKEQRAEPRPVPRDIESLVSAFYVFPPPRTLHLGFFGENIRQLETNRVLHAGMTTQMAALF